METFYFYQDLKPANYLNDQERSKTIENQLSAPKPKETATTPQPEETMAVNIVNIPGGFQGRKQTIKTFTKGTHFKGKTGKMAQGNSLLGKTIYISIFYFDAG